MEKNADVNIKTKRNETALDEAATAGNEEVVKMLLDRGADVNITDVRGYTALLYAAGSDAMPAGIVKLLLAKGASLEAKGDGETAAMLAAKRGDSEVARLLNVSEDQRKRLGMAALPQGAGVQRSVAEAVKPALELLEKQSYNFIRVAGCNSCHAQDLPSAAVAIARDHGMPAPKQIPQLPQTMHSLNADRIMLLAPVAVAGMGWELFDFGENRVPHDEYTDATIRYLKSMQSADGNWRAGEGHRPPSGSGSSSHRPRHLFAQKGHRRTGGYGPGGVLRCRVAGDRNAVYYVRPAVNRSTVLGLRETRCHCRCCQWPSAARGRRRMEPAFNHSLTLMQPVKRFMRCMSRSKCRPPIRLMQRA